MSKKTLLSLAGVLLCFVGALLLAGAIGSVAREQPPKFTKLYNEGYFITGTIGDTIYEQDPSLYYTIKAADRKKEHIKLKSYKCYESYKGGKNRSFAKEIWTKCVITQIAPKP